MSLDLTFVFPCLNEEETLGACIREVRMVLERSQLEWEIIVADNGSTDRSKEIAMEEGARVVPVKERGYGAALRGGIEAASSVYVAFADADGSYPVGDVLRLYEEAEAHGADMVLGSRLDGRIEPGAMPPLHRYLGTPVLTGLINLLFRGHVTDCNCGFRLLRTEAFAEWGVHADGMEFASELLIRALKHGARLREVPLGLRRDRRCRPPHLRTWRDGMRHLLFIFSERPQVFEWLGLIGVLAATVFQILAYVVGLVRVLGFNVFDYHTQALLIPIACTGIQLYVFSCFLYVSNPEERPGPWTRALVAMDEAHVLLALLAMGALELAGFAVVFVRWMNADFRYLDMIRFILLLTHGLCVIGFVGTGLLGLHVFMKRRR